MIWCPYSNCSVLINNILCKRAGAPTRAVLYYFMHACMHTYIFLHFALTAHTVLGLSGEYECYNVMVAVSPDHSHVLCREWPGDTAIVYIMVVVLVQSCCSQKICIFTSLGKEQ